MIAVFATLASFFVITITCVARSSSNYQPSVSVWGTFVNRSGWSSGGVAFLTGLVTPNYMYAGIDGALHLAEECKNASTVVPRALMSTLLIGFISSFTFMVAMLYCTSDLDAVVASSTGYACIPIFRDISRLHPANYHPGYLFSRCGTRLRGQMWPLQYSSFYFAAPPYSPSLVLNKLLLA
jgi:choline transport protein